MGESTRLRFGTRRILERILQDPDSEWTVLRMQAVAGDDERCVEQAIDVLRAIGAVTLELIPDSIRFSDDGRKRISAHRYRLTDDGPRRIQDALDASRYRPGTIVAFLIGGWGPAKMVWQSRRGAGRRVKARTRRPRAGEDGYSYLDPEVNSRLGRLRRWLQERSTRPRTKKRRA